VGQGQNPRREQKEKNKRGQEKFVPVPRKVRQQKRRQGSKTSSDSKRMSHHR